MAQCPSLLFDKNLFFSEWFHRVGLDGHSKLWAWGRFVIEISLNHGRERIVADGQFHRLDTSVSDYI
jgi:hypothetical protein